MKARKKRWYEDEWMPKDWPGEYVPIWSMLANPFKWISILVTGISALAVGISLFFFSGSTAFCIGVATGTIIICLPVAIGHKDPYRIDGKPDNWNIVRMDRSQAEGNKEFSNK